MHHEFDPKRFLLPPNVEAGYERFFRDELSNPQAVILAAEQDQELLGYAYGRIEQRDWNKLLERHGAIHDLFVTPPARSSGVGRKLLESMVEQLAVRGARQFILYTATQNVAAQRLFGAFGFRPTMIEMTWDPA
jgi:ribosomal protein S18 acetylase RimI-like enzyme